MKHNVFSHRPCRLIWHALVALNLVFALCLFLNNAAAEEKSFLSETAVVSNPNPQDRLNLREQPSETAASLGKYYNGVVVQVNQNLQNGWAYVTVGKGEGAAHGYMSTQYLAFGQDAQTIVSAIPQYETTSSQWSLRAMPDDYSVELPIFYASGMEIDLLGFTDEWWHVRVDDCTGYIRHNPAAFKQLMGHYYDGYRIGIVNNANPSDRLNLRKQPKANAASLGKYYNGCVVALLSDESDGWIHVRIGNLEGYMDTRYLLLDAEINSVASAMPTLTIRNSSGTGLNLHENPVKSSATLGVYLNGRSVQVLGLSENWYHVQVAGKTGFMISSGFSDRLSYFSTDTGSSSKDDTDWNGPIGTHKTAEWPIAIDNHVAVVSNPDAADRVHLRIEPDSNSKSLGKYYNGVQVVINSDIFSTWVEVAIGNLVGYMKSECLCLISNPSPTKSAIPVLIINNPNPSHNLHLREDQTTRSKSLGLYPNGTEVLLMGFNSEWAHVIVDGKMGFMLLKYLE